MLDPSDGFWNRNLQAAVVKTVLVLRIVASDKQTTATEAELADKIFGASGDVINLKSLYNQCSNGQLQFEPQTNNNLIGTDGVYTVSLPTTVVTNADDSTIRDAAIAKAQQDFGGTALNTIANHVIVCIPPGTAGGDWLAYAYVNHWLSVFNDNWCKSPSTQMHELGEFIHSLIVIAWFFLSTPSHSHAVAGHNLNIAHAGKEKEEYGDQSGMMVSFFGDSLLEFQNTTYDDPYQLKQ